MNIQRLPFPFVPTYVSGELLLSWIMRIHALNSNSDPRETLSLLFGSATGVPSADYPCRLHRFIETTGSWGPFNTAESVARRASLFPYLTRFLGPIRQREVLTTLSGDSGGGLKVSTGLVANRFGASTLLRTCPVCTSESIRAHGSVILYCMHQLPGIGVCPIHGVPLRGHGVQSLQANRQDLRMPTCTDVKRSQVSIASPLKSSVAMRFARLSLEALESETPPVTNDVRAKTYITRLRHIGFANGRKVDWAALASALLQEYDDFNGLEFKNRLMATPLHPLRWLEDLVARPERALHPICHLTLIGYLFQDLQSYTAATRVCAPDSDANQSPRMLPKLVATADAPISPLRDMGLSCRTAARLLGISVTTAATYRRAAGIPVSERPKTVTKDVQQIALQMLSTGASVPEICKATGISVSSVYRIMRWVPEIKENRTLLRLDARVRQLRSEWLAIQRRYVSESSTELRAYLPATYMWLYRHDKEWLLQNSPPRVPRSLLLGSCGSKWTVVDADLSALLRRRYSQILPLNSSVRVSTTLLLRWTQRPTTVRNNLHKLPLVSRTIDELTESQTEFNLRRMRYARTRLLLEGYDDPSDWRVLRRSGVRGPPLQKIHTSSASISSLKRTD